MHSNCQIDLAISHVTYKILLGGATFGVKKGTVSKRGKNSGNQNGTVNASGHSHTMNSGSEIVNAKHVSEKDIFW